MGMAASQARLLSLTSRLSDLEYNSQLVSNEKMALARQSSDASDKYIAALDGQIIKVVDDDDNSKVTATAANLTTYNAISSLEKQRMLKTTSGELIVSQDIADAYKVAKATSSANSGGSATLTEYIQKLEGSGFIQCTTATTTSTFTNSAVSDYSGDIYYKNFNSKYPAEDPCYDSTTYRPYCHVSTRTKDAAAQLNSTDADTIARKVASYADYSWLTSAQSASQNPTQPNSKSNDLDFAFAQFGEFVSAYKDKTSIVSRDTDEQLAARLHLFTDLILKSRLNTETGEGANRLDPTDEKTQAAITLALNATPGELVTVQLTDAEKASGSYIRETIDNAITNGHDNWYNYQDLWNDYAKIVTYQESWKDAVEEQGAVATTTTVDDASGTTTTSVASYDAKTGKKTATTTTTINSTVKTYNEGQIAYYSDLYTSGGADYFLNQFGYSGDSTNSAYDKGATSWYGEIFEQMNECGYEVVADDKLNDNDWLYQQLSFGNIYLSEKVANAGEKGEAAWKEVSWTSGDNEITTVDDTTGYAKAEAEYEATTQEISSKDERYDLQLKNIDTEHSSVQTEIETVGKVINKNIERSFKMFDA